MSPATSCATTSGMDAHIRGQGRCVAAGRAAAGVGPARGGAGAGRAGLGLRRRARRPRLRRDRLEPRREVDPRAWRPGTAARRSTRCSPAPRSSCCWCRTRRRPRTCSTRGGSRCCRGGAVVVNPGPRRADRRGGAARRARRGPPRPRHARRLPPGAAASGPPVLEPSAGHRDAAHRLRDPPRDRLARDRRERPARRGRPAVPPPGRPVRRLLTPRVRRHRSRGGRAGSVPGARRVWRAGRVATTGSSRRRATAASRAVASSEAPTKVTSSWNASRPAKISASASRGRQRLLGLGRRAHEGQDHASRAVGVVAPAPGRPPARAPPFPPASRRARAATAPARRAAGRSLRAVDVDGHGARRQQPRKPRDDLRRQQHL